MTAVPRRASFPALLLLALLLALAVAGGAWLVFERSVRAPPAPRQVAEPHGPVPAPPMEPPAVVEPTVVSLEGMVERSGPAGSWEPVLAGERLQADGALRTARGARADLAVGPRARITVAERSQVAVAEVSAAVHRWKLVRGRIGVDYQADGARVLRIEGAGGAATAETTGARFSALATSLGLAVATESGSVNLAAAGKAVVVAAGEASAARAGEAPLPPEPIPRALLLKVARSGSEPRAGACARLRGTAEPGTEVTVDGEAVPLGRAGDFDTLVPGRPGKREVVVAVRDAAGRVVERRLRCDAPPDISDLKVRWKRGSPN